MTKAFHRFGRRSVCISAMLLLTVAACGGGGRRGGAEDADTPHPSPSPTGTPIPVDEATIVDGHVHLTAILGSGLSDYDGAAQVAMARMDGLGITRSILMPTPFPADWPQTYDAAPLAAVVARYPNRLSFVAGGGSLNVLIQRALAGKPVGDQDFDDTARGLLDQGAVGFGELAAEHIVIGGTEPYVHAPPNHPLFKRLANIAAQYDVPIDLHMEAVPEDMPIPPPFASPKNPAMLEANIAELEELLAHNRAAKIIWSHAGWDTVGERTAALCNDLLARHSNLYMGIKRTLDATRNALVDQAGNVRPEWMVVFETFPSRFLLGSDQFYQAPGLDLELPDGAATTVDLLSRLPADLAIRFGSQNAKNLYRLP